MSEMLILATSFMQSYRLSNETTIVNFLMLVLIVYALVHQSSFIYRKTRSRKARLPPGPTQWPIVGNALQLFRKNPTFRCLHQILEDMDTDIACVRFGNVYVIPVICPKLGLEFLKNHDAVFASRPITMATNIFSRGGLTTIFSPYGDQWKKMRKILVSRVVSPASHEWLHGRRVEEADNLVKYVFSQSSISDGLVDIRIAARHYAGNVIRKMVFSTRYFGEGRKDGGPGFEEEEHVGAIFTGLYHFYRFCISDYFPFLVHFDMFGHGKHVQEAFKIVNKYHDPIIEDRFIKHQRQDYSSWSNEQRPQDLLDVFISLRDADGKPLLSVDEIKAQITELMIGAVDNPSNAAEWAMAEMINEPELLEKAVKELDEVVGKSRLVQERDIPSLNFIKACVREAFRLHPVAPFNPPHVALEDTVVGGYFIPKGSHVILSRTGLGRNPNVWPDEPLKFKPERHILEVSGGEVVLAEPNLRFISFATGRRGCVAANLGTTMSAMLLARLLQGFNWKAPSTIASIDLSESKDDLFLAKPLVLHAKPRLPLHLYHQGQS